MPQKLTDRISRRRKVVFMYSHRYTEGGGTVMRGYQLSGIMRKHLGDKYKVSYLPIGKYPKSNVIFMPKMTIFTINKLQLRLLKSLGNRIVFDPIDERIPDEKLQFADCIVAASREAVNVYIERYPEKYIATIDHHVDPRINMSVHRLKKPNIGYFGEPANTIITPAIQKYVDVWRVDTSSQKETEWINKISSYNVHYAIRKTRDLDDCKPATKIFTAARCNANVIVQDTEKEAIRWLGDGYPYIIRGKVTESSILEMLEYVRNSYGSEEWRSALKVMDSINERVSDVNIANQVDIVLTKLSRGSRRSSRLFSIPREV